MKRHVLIVEDDRDIANLLQMSLANETTAVTVARDGALGMQQALARSWDLVILDWMLPGLDGMEICRRLRKTRARTPILMLTARTAEGDRIQGLDAGADDYIVKPFSVLEVAARVRSIFRRVDALARPDEEELVVVGDLSIDCATRAAHIGGRAVELTAREFDLLEHLARHPGRVFTRVQLLEQVWGTAHDGYDHTVNSHINRLRAKIEIDPANPRRIQTVWGVGYRLAAARS